MTATVDAKEEQDVMSTNLPNAFIQAEVPKDKKKSKRIIMKTTRKLVDVLISIALEIYGGYVVYKNGKKSYTLSCCEHYTAC